MVSRVAEAVFWMSRYLERADNVARFIDVNDHLSLESPNQGDEQWAPLVYTTGDQDAFLASYDSFACENVLSFLTFDAKNPNSVYSCIQRVRENARMVRDILSSEMWEAINKFYHDLREAAAASGAPEARRTVRHVKYCCHLIQGIADATMSHGEPWHFARMGQLLERADKTSRILDVKYFILLPHPDDIGTPLDIVQWSALLRSASALEMYRKSKGRILPAHVAEFLILDRLFPRSMRFCLIEAELSLHAITGTPLGSFCNRAEQRLGRLRSGLEFTSIDDIIGGGMHEFIDYFQLETNAVGEAIHETFFAAAEPKPREKMLQTQGQPQ